MKKIYSLFIMSMLLLSMMPFVMAIDTGTGIPVDVEIEDFKPLIWMCDHRVVRDDPIEWGRVTGDDDPMCERMGNYAFEGETIEWKVLVMDKNKIEQVDVYMSIDGAPTDTECKEFDMEHSLESCNAWIDEEKITEFNPETMQLYKCVYTVRSSNVDYDETEVTIEVDDGYETTTIDEDEWWFFNPMVALSIDEELSFETEDRYGVRPGTTVYSDTIKVRNLAEDASGVMLDMFISGDDFEGEGNCPDTNSLALGNFAYFATKGAYSTSADSRSDAEGYVGIGYGDRFVTGFYDSHEILQMGPKNGAYYLPNILAPNDWVTMTFRLSVPEPCNGRFDEGQISFWGEAI